MFILSNFVSITVVSPSTNIISINESASIVLKHKKVLAFWANGHSPPPELLALKRRNSTQRVSSARTAIEEAFI